MWGQTFPNAQLELCSFGFLGVSLISRRFAARRAAKPASSQKKGGDQRKGAGVPLCTETLEKLSFAPWLFKRFPYLPAVCGPKGRVSRPAARKRGRSASGRWNGGSKGALPRPLANLCLLSFRKKVEARRGQIKDKRKMRVQPARNRQTDSQNKTELRTQSARRANRHRAQKPVKKQQVTRPSGREQSRRRRQERKIPVIARATNEKKFARQKPNRKR